MAFQFSLESVLRLRRSEQRQQELILQKMNQQVNMILREVEILQQEAERISTAQQSRPELTGAELEFHEGWRATLQIRLQDTLSRLQRAREQQAFAAVEFRQVWQRREALEAMLEREREAYRTDEERREQRRQDDRFLQARNSR